MQRDKRLAALKLHQESVFIPVEAAQDAGGLVAHGTKQELHRQIGFRHGRLDDAGALLAGARVKARRQGAADAASPPIGRNINLDQIDAQGGSSRLFSVGLGQA